MSAEKSENELRGDGKIGIVGPGLMGKQMSIFLSKKGFNILLLSRSSTRASLAKDEVEKILLRKSSPDEAADILNNIEFSSDYAYLSNVPIVIETVTEDIGNKREVFASMSKNCREDAILASNTSSLSISEISEVVENPARVIGMHFFNPVSKMRLVELVRGRNTAGSTISESITFAKKLDKIPIVVNDTPGFIVNRLLMSFINESARLVEEGVSIQDIDSAVKLGLNHPMGPLEIADLIGVDTCVSILKVLEEGIDRERYAPSTILVNMLEEGRIGRKTGKGFY